RGREGQPDAGADQGGRPQLVAAEPVHEGLAGEQEPMNRLVRGLAGGLTLLAAGAASAQQPAPLGDRPSEQDLFGGSAPASAPAPAAAPPAVAPATTSPVPPAAPASPAAQPGEPAAAATQGTSRDQE